MPTDLTPDSYKDTSPASADWVEYLMALRDHVANTSSRWSVKQTTDDTGGSGDYGFTATPDATGESFEINFRYDAGVSDIGGTSGVMYAAIDPQAQIGDPLDPTGTGSSAVSTERTYAGPGDSGGLGWSTDLLVSEMPDALILIFKDGAGGVPWILQIGRLLVTPFANDASRGLDGLGWMSGPARWVEGGIPSSRHLLSDRNDAYNGSELRTATSSWTEAYGVSTGSRPGGWDQYSPSLSYAGASYRLPRPVSVREVGSSNARRAEIGAAKYLYRWTTEGELYRIPEDGGPGGLLVVRNGNNASSVVPWNPSVAP